MGDYIIHIIYTSIKNFSFSEDFVNSISRTYL